MHYLAQTGFWTEMSPEKFGLLIAAWATGIAALIYAVFKIIDLCVEKWFGTKKLIAEKQQELEAEIARMKDRQKAMAQVISPNPAPETAKAIVETTAWEETKEPGK